jgi:hypothetical protein
MNYNIVSGGGGCVVGCGCVRARARVCVGKGWWWKRRLISLKINYRIFRGIILFRTNMSES